ncbi:MAG: tyrosine recombinase XerC, partial [Verrucomicrobia bacterium]
MIPIEKFIEHLNSERHLSKYTRRNYQHAIENFFEWLKKSEKWSGDLTHITKIHLKGFIIEFR